MRFVTETHPEVGVAAVLGPEDLDGDVAIELRIVGPIDRRHATLAEEFHESISSAENAADLRQVVVSPWWPGAHLRGGRAPAS